MKDLAEVGIGSSNVKPLGSSIVTVVQFDKNTTKLEGANIIRAIALKDVDSFIIDISAINDKDETILYKEGFIRKCTFGDMIENMLNMFN